MRVRQSLSPVSLGFAQGLLIGRAMQLCEQGACAEEHVLELSALTTDDVLARLVELGIAPPPEVSPTPNRLH